MTFWTAIQINFVFVLAENPVSDSLSECFHAILEKTQNFWSSRNIVLAKMFCHLSSIRFGFCFSDN